MLFETFGAEELGPDGVRRVRQRSRRERPRAEVSEQCPGSQPRHVGGPSAPARMGERRARSLADPRATLGGSSAAPVHCPATITVQFKTVSPRSGRAEGAGPRPPWLLPFLHATRFTARGLRLPARTSEHGQPLRRSYGSLAARTSLRWTSVAGLVADVVRRESTDTGARLSSPGRQSWQGVGRRASRAGVRARLAPAPCPRAPRPVGLLPPP